MQPQPIHPPAAGQGLGAALRAYRRDHSLSQAQLGELVGLHQSYISLLERGRRQVHDIATLERVAGHIGWNAVPPATLERPLDWSVELGWSVVRLGDAARASGRPLLAVRELWPLVQRLHGATSSGRDDGVTTRLAASATLSLVTALGDVLTQERLGLAIDWCDRALDLAAQLDDDRLRTHALRTKGNELRKAGRVHDALLALRRSRALASHPADRGTAAALLARCAAEAGDATLFQEALRDAYRLLDSGHFTSAFHPYALDEIQLRGLVRLHRLQQARELLRRDPAVVGGWVTPQWRVLRLITEAHAALALQDTDRMADLVWTALRMAEQQHLSRQIQRILHVVALAPSGDARVRLRDQSRAALARLEEPAALPA